MPKQLLEHGRSRVGNGLSASKKLCRTGVFRYTRRYPGRSGPIVKFSYWGRHGLPGYLVFSVKHLPKKKGYPGKVPKSTSAPIENFLSGGALPGYLEKSAGPNDKSRKAERGRRRPEHNEPKATNPVSGGGGPAPASAPGACRGAASFYGQARGLGTRAPRGTIVRTRSQTPPCQN